MISQPYFPLPTLALVLAICQLYDYFEPYLFVRKLFEYRKDTLEEKATKDMGGKEK